LFPSIVSPFSRNQKWIFFVVFTNYIVNRKIHYKDYEGGKDPPLITPNYKGALPLYNPQKAKEKDKRLKRQKLLRKEKPSSVPAALKTKAQ